MNWLILFVWGTVQRVSALPDLRWHLFCKQLAAESNKLPPTHGALEEHIKRVRLQSRVWFQLSHHNAATTFEPLNFGYYKNTDGQILPVTTKVLPAPQAINELVRCCKTDCSTLRCSCRKNNLPCTELCSCDTGCANDEDGNDTDSDDDDNEQ